MLWKICKTLSPKEKKKKENWQKTYVDITVNVSLTFCASLSYVA